MRKSTSEVTFGYVTICEILCRWSHHSGGLVEDYTVENLLKLSSRLWSPVSLGWVQTWCVSSLRLAQWLDLCSQLSQFFNFLLKMLLFPTPILFLSANLSRIFSVIYTHTTLHCLLSWFCTWLEHQRSLTEFLKDTSIAESDCETFSHQKKVFLGGGPHCICSGQWISQASNLNLK